MMSTSKEEMPGQLPTLMKAWQSTSYTGLAGLQLVKDAPVPTILKPQELLIQVKAASVNPIDVLGYGSTFFNLMHAWSEWIWPGSYNPFPLRLGRDFSGIVVNKGSDCEDFKVGDQVWGSITPGSPGCLAEYILMPKRLVGPKPKNLSHTEAASIPYVGLTSWASIVTAGKLQPDSPPKRILIVGAAGGLGTISVQLLKAWNHEVIGVAKGDTFQLLESLGTDKVLDYTLPDFQTQLESVGEFDLILDYSGARNKTNYYQFLKNTGQSMFVTPTSPVVKEMDSRGLVLGAIYSIMELRRKNQELRDKNAGFKWGFYSANKTALYTFSKLVEEKKIRPVLEKVFSFEEANVALEKVAKGSSRGKLVVEM